MTLSPARAFALIRARLGMACGVVLVLGSLIHLAVNATGAGATRPELLLVYVALVVSAGLLGTRRAHGWQRGMQLGVAALTVASGLALVATTDPAAQNMERGATLVLLLAFSLSWARKPLRGALQNGVDAAQFGIGLFVADQLAVFGIGDLILITWPDLAHQSWPFSVVGELVQETCLLLVLGLYAIGAPGLFNWTGLRVPGWRWTDWRPVGIAALQVEFGVIVLQLVVGLVLLSLHVDLASIGNATFPAPGEWHPSVPVALLLLAMLPGIVEEIIFRGVIFRTLRTSMPLAFPVAISSALFSLGHLSPDMTPATRCS